jgi:hypothetical protein
MGLAKAALIAAVTVSFTGAASAIDLSETKSVVDCWATSNGVCKCPKEKIDETGLWDISKCSQLQPDYSKVIACQNEQMRIAKLVSDYNKIVDKCTKQSATKSDIQQRLKKREEAAKQYSAIAQRQKQEVSQKEQEIRQEQESEAKEEEQAKERERACQKEVDDCKQRYASLGYLGQQARSQCDAYCTNLKIEKCNSTSSTIKQAEQKCKELAEADLNQGSTATPVGPAPTKSRCYDHFVEGRGDGKTGCRIDCKKIYGYNSYGVNYCDVQSCQWDPVRQKYCFLER